MALRARLAITPLAASHLRKIVTRDEHQRAADLFDQIRDLPPGQRSQAINAACQGITLTGLLPNTPYYFVAQSADVNGDTGYSTTYSFTTLAGAPVISAVTATPGGNNTAAIGWTTSVPTYSYVQYGPAAGSYNRYSAQSALTTTPQLTLPYVPSGTVHYQLVSTDANGNQAVSPDAVFVEP